MPVTDYVKKCLAVSYPSANGFPERPPSFAEFCDGVTGTIYFDDNPRQLNSPELSYKTAIEIQVVEKYRELEVSSA